MARNRTIYQVQALYVGPTGTAGAATGDHYRSGFTGVILDPTNDENYVKELLRVQSANYSSSKTLTDVNQYGELAAIDRIPLEQPTVSLDFTYLQANLINESYLGFTVLKHGVDQASWVSAVSGILATTTDTKNYFIAVGKEGADVHAQNLQNAVNTGAFKTVAIGNGFITSYTTEGSVGNFPTVTVNVEGLNMNVDHGLSGTIPAVNPVNGTAITAFDYFLPSGRQNWEDLTINDTSRSLSVLRPGDITLNLGINDVAGRGDAFVDDADLKIQSYSLSYDLARENLNKLGSKYAFAKVITFPVNATLTVTADVGDLATGSLVEMINNNTSFSPMVTIVHPTTADPLIKLQLKGAKLDTQDFSSSIGANNSVTLTFTSQIGGPEATGIGVFMSGVTET